MITKTEKPYLTIPLLEVCNFRCVYCPPEGETYHTPKAVFAPETVKKVLATAVDADMEKVRFSGGEPLLYPHLQEVMAYAFELGLDVHMNTNGLLLTKHLHWLKLFPDLVLKVSLDAVTDASMKSVAKVAQIDKVLDGIRQGAKLGLVRRLNFVLTRLNADQIPGILALCKELGIGLKIFDMYPVPETEPAWHAYFAPIDVLSLAGEVLPPDLYTQKFGTPTQELLVDGVHVRIKNCFTGTRYHAMCESCPAFPCPEGLYCLQVTPSLTAVPCRLAPHLYEQCNDFDTLQATLQKFMGIYEESYFMNGFGAKYQSFHDTRLAELEGRSSVPASQPISLSTSVLHTETVRC